MDNSAASESFSFAAHRIKETSLHQKHVPARVNDLGTLSGVWSLKAVSR
jgi:hypothetical protein